MIARRITRLEPRDVADALRLSTQAGWNQVEADWLRLMALWPETCFVLRDDDGQIVATSTLASYGGLGWVGMVLVDEALRGQGLGGTVFDAALAAGEELPFIGLDATDLGMPVYLKHGFAPQVTINRWGGSMPRPCQSCARAAIDSDWPAILELDRRATGVDRSALLRTMSEEAGVRLRVIEQAERLDGFGLARAGRVAGHIGPVVANSVDTATELTEALCDEERVFIDVPAGAHDNGFDAWMKDHGFCVFRRLTRMAKPARTEPLLATARVFATAALELG